MLPTINLLGRELPTYALCSLVGVLLSGLYVCVSAKKKGEDDNDAIFILLAIGAGVLIGGHLLYALVSVPSVIRSFQNGFRLDSIRKFGELLVFCFGGSVFYGGLGGGALAAWIYTRRRGLDQALYADLLAPAIALFHGFGRIGCFLGGCCFGIECEFGFTYTHNPIEIANGVPRFPVQLVESLVEFTLFLVLYLLYRHGKMRGRLILVYLLSYAPARFLLEFLRGDTYRGIWGPFSTSQWISLCIVAGCVLYIIVSNIRKKRAAAKNSR